MKVIQKTVVKIISDIRRNFFFHFVKKTSINIMVKIEVIALIINEIFLIELSVNNNPNN